MLSAPPAGHERLVIASKVAEANLDRAVTAGIATLNAHSSIRWTPLRILLSHICKAACVDQLTARLACDELIRMGAMEFIAGRGVRHLDRAPAARVVSTSSHADLEAQLADLSARLAIVDAPENNPWLLREQLDNVRFLLGIEPTNGERQ
jgi:hypothetical protein